MINIFLRIVEVFLAFILTLILLFEIMGFAVIEQLVFKSPFFLSGKLFDSLLFVGTIRTFDRELKAEEKKEKEVVEPPKHYSVQDETIS